MSFKQMCLRAIFVLGLVGVLPTVTALPAHAESIDQSRSTATNLGLYGGEVRDIAVDTTSSYIYASTYSPNGVFISPDNGETWRGLPAGTNYGEPRGVEIDSEGTAYALLAEGLFKTSNHGGTWTKAEGFDDPYGSSMTIASDDTLYVGRTDGKVSVSRDGGATFTTTVLHADTEEVRSVTGTDVDGTAYAITLTENAGSSLLYKTTDFGVSWTLVDTTSMGSVVFTTVASLPDDVNYILLLASGADLKPWRSTTGGGTWTELDVTPAATHVDFDSTGRIYLGVDYSDDGGATWSNINDSTPTSRVSGFVTADPEDSNILYGASFAAFAKSIDRGTTWSDSNQGITAVTVLDVAQSKDKNTVWVATNAGLARTTNFRTEAPTWTFPIQYDLYGQSLWVDPTDENHVVVGGYQNIYYTTNGGDSWNTASGWNTSFAVQQIVQKPGDEDVLYAAAAYQNYATTKSGGVYRSEDGGVTWTNMNFPGNAAVQSISVKTNGTVYAGTGHVGMSGTSATGVYKYNGSSWSKLTGSPAKEIPALAVDPNNEDIIYATAADFNTRGDESTTGFFRSADGGVTWTKITSGLSDAGAFRSIALQDSGSVTNVYVGGRTNVGYAGSIYKSTNNGEDFGLYYTGLRNENFNALLFDGLVSGNTRGLYSVEGKATFSLKTGTTKVKKHAKATVSVTLKDAATKKTLRSKKVSFYKKTGTKWVKMRTVKTTIKGEAKASLLIHKTTRVKAVWTPNNIDREEFQKSTSAIKKFTVRR